MIQAILLALSTAFDMLWEVFWPLALGFILSAIVQTLVSRRTVERALGSDSPRSLALATAFGKGPGILVNAGTGSIAYVIFCRQPIARSAG